MVDIGRQHDLLFLTNSLKEARDGREKEKIEKIMYKVVNESISVRSLRNELIGAMRAGDRNKVRKLQMHIQYIRKNETNGTEWG